jgi:hypothetical protein
VEAAVENVNVYVIKERIQMIIADIVLDLIPLGVPEVSKKISLEMMQLLGWYAISQLSKNSLSSWLQEKITAIRKSDYIICYATGRNSTTTA